MSFNVGELVGYLRLDTSGVGKGIRTAQAEVKRGLTSMDKDAGQAGSKVGTAFAGGLGKALKAGAGIFAGAMVLDKVVAYFRGAIDLAGESAAAVKRTNIVFGQNSTAMQAWAANAARSFGLSSAAALSSAASFGDMFAQLGFAGDKAAGMSKQVVALAADLGAFKGLGTEDVLERIAAGFRGEYDSLQLLVPSISAAAIEQQAMADTGKKSAAALTQQEKAAATLAVVTKGAANAIGFYAKNVDDKAQAERTAAAAAQDLAVKVGNMLLPAYTALVRFGRDQVIPFLSGTADAVAAASVVIGPLVSGIGSLVTAFRDLPGPLQAGILGMATFLLMRDKFAGFGTAVSSHLATAKSTVQSFGEAVKYAGQASERAGGGLAGFAAGARTFTGSALSLKGAASGLLGVLGGPWGAAFTGATMLVGAWVQKQAEGKARVQELSDSLDQQTGAITDNTRALMARRLADEGVLQLAKDMGLALDLVTDAALGNAEAYRQVSEAAQAYLSGVGTDEVAVGSALDRLREFQGALKDVNGETTEAVQLAELRSAAMGQSATATSSAVGPTQDHARSLDNEGRAADAAASALQGYVDAITKAAKPVLDARDAHRQVEEALLRVNEVIASNGKNLDEHAAKSDKAKRAALDNQGALDAVAKALGGELDAMRQAGAGHTELDAKLSASRAQLYETARRFNMTEAEAKAYVDQVLAIPPSKVTDVTINTEAALWKVKQLKAQLDLIRDKTVSVTLIQQTKNAVAHGADWQANGSIRMDGVRMMASGDITRQAMIMRRTAPILWNEAQGGESYIPLAPSKRARSLRIWEKTGELLGVGAGGGGGLSADALASAVSHGVAKGLNGALDGATLRLGDVDKITNEVAAQLLIARRRAL